ncbi:MAG: septum formation protein Maf [Ignavibacteria bacterium]|nr:septum formation protein Maf [Ignavibacteria bacterium]
MKKRTNARIILASASPRRKLLLRGLLNNFGLKFVVKPANIVEHIPEKINDFGMFAANLAYEKGIAVAKKEKGIIIAADTIVVCNKKVLGKPANREEASNMLKMLSGRVHEVYTGLVILDAKSRKCYKVFEVTKVKFRKILRAEIEYYTGTKSPYDKAGAYGIQDDFGSTFVESLKGDYFNVVGLPIVKTYVGLQKFMKLI